MNMDTTTCRQSPGAGTLTRAVGAKVGFVPGATASRRAVDDPAARFAPSTYNAKSHTVTAILSAGARIPRWDGLEELSITPAAIDLSRVELGQVRVLDTHNKTNINAILGVVESAWFEGGKLLGRLRFADTDAGRGAEAMASRGELSGVSVGYAVSAWSLAGTENNLDIWRADKWELLEVSLVSVPADREALIRSAQQSNEKPKKGNRMDPEDIEVIESNTGSDNNSLTRAATTPTRTMSDRHAREAFDMVARAGLPGEFARSRVDSGATIDQVRSAVFDELAARGDRTRTNNIPHNDQTFDNPNFQSRAIEDVLYARMSGKPIENPAGAELMGLSLLELGARNLSARGERVSWADRGALGSRILDRTMGSGHTTSDFPVLLSNAGQRVLLDAYRSAETPLKKIARRRDTADFRPVTAVRLSEAPELLKVNESGEIKHGSRSEAKEMFKVETFARIFGISRNAIVNDDLNAFSDSSVAWGRAAAETEANALVSLFLKNNGTGPTLDDGKPVWHAAHGNIAATGSALSVESLSAARLAMRAQRGLDSKAPIVLTPKHLVVGAENETVAERVLASLSPTTVGEVNPFAGKLNLHVEPRLAGLIWTLFADPAEIPSLLISYLNGSSGPQLSVQEGWSTLGTEFRAILDFGCGFADYRGSYLNPGPTPAG